VSEKGYPYTTGRIFDYAGRPRLDREGTDFPILDAYQGIRSDPQATVTCLREGRDTHMSDAGVGWGNPRDEANAIKADEASAGADPEVSVGGLLHDRGRAAECILRETPDTMEVL
jgi:hypothetical protein